MTEKNYTGVIPEQHTGTPIDAEASENLPTEAEAKSLYASAKNKLQHVNEWHKYAGALSAKFQLVDQNGNEVERTAQKGDYFKIDIPGPGTVSGDGYDWVQIEDLQETSTGEVESFGLRVRPAKNPLNKNTDTAHFYSEESTSSFTVTREGTTVTAAIYDRNTKANTDANSIVDKVRDAVVGSSGIMAFSKVQWKALSQALLKVD